MTYCELNDAQYSDLRKRLIKEKGSAFQIEFLNVLKDTNQFINWVEDKIKIEKGEAFDIFADTLSENEFKDLPIFMEAELFGKWQDITPAQACRATFWGYMTLRHIKENKIEAHYLAANGGTLPGGLERIDAALDSGDAKKIDSIVRTALRRFSGLPEARGNRTVYVDCPFARAWWRGHIAQEVCAITEATPNAVMDVLRVNQAYWENLISSAVSKNSVFGDISIRASLVWALSDIMATNRKSNLFIAKTLDSIIKRTGVRLAWQELAILDPVELKALFENEFFIGLNS